MTISLRLQEAQDIDTSELTDLSVLVVDDDDCACQSLCTMLDEIGMRSAGCTSGQDAVAAVQRAMNTALPFYAAILDWKMPIMNGYDAAASSEKISEIELKKTGAAFFVAPVFFFCRRAAAFILIYTFF